VLDRRVRSDALFETLPRRASTQLSILVGVQLLLAFRFWFVCDDAYITFRYAKHWARGQGIVFNVSEFPPVEGYSDFLWLVFATLTERLSLPTDLLLPAFSALCGTALVWRVYTVCTHHLALGRGASFLATGFVAASPAFAVWSTSGLETMPQALLTFLLFEELVFRRDDREWAVPALLALGLALIRTEGIGWVAVVIGASTLAAWRDGHPLPGHLRRVARAMLPVALMLGVYHVWRMQYYGTLVPNTALVKVSTSLRSVFRGFKYVALFTVTTVSPLAPALALGWSRTWTRGPLLAALTCAAAFPTYATLVGGDFMPFGRMLVPGLPFAALLWAELLHELVRRRGERTAAFAGLAVILVGAMPAFDLHLAPERVRSALHFRLSDKDYLSEFNRWENQRENSEGFMHRGLALSQVADPGDAVVAAAVGAIGYFSDLEVLDQHGLVTKEVAYRPVAAGPLRESPGHDKHVTPEYFAKYSPRYLFARAVWGRLAAGRMKDTLDAWDVDPSVTSRYVPDIYEVSLPDIPHRAFLLVVRRVEPGEKPLELWESFAERRKNLNAELRAEYEVAEQGDEDGPAEDEAP
jgi:arabinofuranosyltransferase